MSEENNEKKPVVTRKIRRMYEAQLRRARRQIRRETARKAGKKHT